MNIPLEYLLAALGLLVGFALPRLQLPWFTRPTADVRTQVLQVLHDLLQPPTPVPVREDDLQQRLRHLLHDRGPKQSP